MVSWTLAGLLVLSMPELFDGNLDDQYSRVLPILFYCWQFDVSFVMNLAPLVDLIIVHVIWGTMDSTKEDLKGAMEEFLEQNFSRTYTSCIKINGCSILPPLMSKERRAEMRQLRHKAVEVETKIIQRRGNNMHDDDAGGEAMYEEVVEELHFANSLPSSLVPATDNCVKSFSQHDENLSERQLQPIEPTRDVIKEFDPLADGTEGSSRQSQLDHLFDVKSCDMTERVNESSGKTISKSSSAESSATLSYSTDLNNYMDVTESSVDVSICCSDRKNVSRTGATTPSTVKPDSADNESQLSSSRGSGKTTYQELSNYLDSLLNSSSSKNAEFRKDSNQNFVSSSSSPMMPSTLSGCSKTLSSDLPPLTSPKGCLKTRVVSDSCLTQSLQDEKDPCESSSLFFENCALSPVGIDVESSYEQKVQSYLQNLIDDKKTVGNLSFFNSGHNVKGDRNLQFYSNDVLADSGINSSNSNGGGQPLPPRLVRSNSYTLDTPSPMLLAHMEAEFQKNERRENCAGERKQMFRNAGPSRRVWDASIAKNMPSWCLRQSGTSNSSHMKQLTKNMRDGSVSSQLDSVESNDFEDLAPNSALKSFASKALSSEAKHKKSIVTPNLRESNTNMLGVDSHSKVTNTSINIDGSENKVSSLLLRLQLQHNEEMEKLLNRQQKEKEAIRLALLDYQIENPEENSQKPSVTAGSQLNQIQSPPTKDKFTLVERRNTSPSIYVKDSPKVEHSHLLCRSSSLSIGNVSSSCKNNTALIDLDCEKERISDSVTPDKMKACVDTQNFGSLTVGPHDTRITESHDILHNTNDMVSSFPASELCCHAGIDNMTSSLPSDILSLHFSNTEMTYRNATSISCSTHSSSLSISKSVPGSVDLTSMAQCIMSSSYPPNVVGGSPNSKRQSWCSRQLFIDDRFNKCPDWVSLSQDVLKNQAASKIQAGVRGYLTRRLLKTERVQNCITTIRDTIVCALQLQRECAPHVEPSDLQLHGRLIQQLGAACEDLHNIFMGLSLSKQMAIIATDRERLRSRTPRSQSSTGSRPLSRATQIVLQRKMNRTEPGDSSAFHSRSSSTGKSRRRSWATVDSRTKPYCTPSNVANNSEVISGCLSRSSAPTPLLQRSASTGSTRRPWR